MSRKASVAGTVRRRPGDGLWAVALLALPVLGLVVFYLWPLVRTIALSFSQGSPFLGYRLSGFENWLDVLTSDALPIALRNTLIYSALVLLGVPIAMIIAALLHQKGLRFRGGYRVLYFLPVVTMPVAVAMVWRYIYNGDFGLLNAVFGKLGQILVASLAAYCLARMRFPGRRALLGAFLVVLMVPPQMFIIPQYEVIRDLNWLNTVPALALPGIFSSFGMFILYQFMRSLPPELDEAAKLDGANPLQIYARVIFPLCMPAVAAVTIMTSLFSWNDLLWPLVINTDPKRMTLPVGLATLQGSQGTDYPVLMAGSLLAILPMIVIFILLQKQFIRGVAMSGSK